VFVRADKQRIGQVIANLVQNACKYAPLASTIKLVVKHDGDYVQIDVIDSGPGIDPKERSQVFDAFFQSDKANEGKTRGAGLGLAICKGLVEGHHGKIWVADSSNHGTTISFTLPLAEQAD
jgi:signal transduction histidine kinase